MKKIDNLFNQKIGILVADIDEIEQSCLSGFKKYKKKSITFYKKKIGNKEFFLVILGVGKTNSAYATSFCIFDLKIKNFFHVGTCGSINMNIGDICLINKSTYVDVDLTSLGYKFGQIPKETQYFKIQCLKLANFISKISCIYKFRFKKNIVVGTMDKFANKTNMVKNTDIKNINIIDMETAAIWHVINKFKDIKILSIKIVTDEIGSKKNDATYRHRLSHAKKDIKNIIELLINN